MTSNKRKWLPNYSQIITISMVWPFISDLPTLKNCCANFFLENISYASKIPYLPTIWTYVQNFVSFFGWVFQGFTRNVEHCLSVSFRVFQDFWGSFNGFKERVWSEIKMSTMWMVIGNPSDWSNFINLIPIISFSWEEKLW